MDPNAPDERPQGLRLTPDEARRQRARSIAIAVLLGLFAVLMFGLTVVKLGPGILRGDGV